MKWAVDGCQEARWDHTAAVVATQMNVAAKKHVVSPDQINPYRNRKVFKPLMLSDMEPFLDP